MTASDAETFPGELLGEVVIDSRFNGPETSANGGYACGALARFLSDPAEITLRLPPPLERPLAVVDDSAGTIRLLDGESVVAEGRVVSSVEAEPPVRPTHAEAAAASARHPGRNFRHPLSDCFVCGPGRGTPGDGLGISPGLLVDHPSMAAAPFVPDESVCEAGIVRPEIVWSALDCPSFPPAMWDMKRIALLGRLSVHREREIRVGEQLAAVGWSVGSEGRKHQTGSALIDGDGEIAGRARATWIELRA